MVQYRGRHARETPAAPPPRDARTRHQGADERHFRRGADRPGVLDRTLHRDPRRGAGDLSDLAPGPARAGLRTGAHARHAGEDLFQERERLARRVAQAQHRRAAGLLQLQAGHQAPDHRDRRRTVGLGHRLRRAAFRSRRAGLHGEGQLRTEALPPAHDEHLGRRVHRLAQHADRLGPGGAGARSALLGQPRPGDLRSRGAGRAAPRGHALLPGQRAEPRAAPPDRHRPGGRGADGAGRRRTRRGDRMLRRRKQLRGHRLPVPAQEPHGGRAARS